MSQETDRKIYMILLIASVVLTMLCFNIDQESPWFTIGTGIGCGGFASTVIAWLIDVANSKKTAEKIIANREMLFRKFFSSFNNGLLILIYNTEKHLKDDAAKTWFQWVDCAYQITQDDPAFSHDFDLSMRIFLDDISEELSGIKAQRAIMMDYGVVSDEDMDALFLIQSISRLAVMGYTIEQNEEILADLIYQHCRAIHDAISSSPAMRFFNETPIDRTRYSLQGQLPG